MSTRSKESTKRKGVRPKPLTVEEKAIQAALEIQVETINQAFLEGAEFTRQTVDILVKADKIRETDFDEETGLHLYCNIRGNPSEPGLERECRGVIFGPDDQLVLKAFPYPIETDTSDREVLDNTIAPIMANCSFYDSHEGALVRMFWWPATESTKGKWYMCTHRKLDAYRSKWASKSSFGESFVAGLEAEIEANSKLKESLPNDDGSSTLSRFQTTLDITKQYMFLIRHNDDNRIVCEAPSRPTIYHVGTFVDGDLVMTENVQVPYPTKHEFASIDELVEAVDNIDPRSLQGIIIFAPGNVQYKVQNTYYRDYFNVRGNEPSIPFRYLHVRTNRDDREILQYLYPKMVDRFSSYENSLYEVAKRILEVYKSRYIHGQNLSYRPIQEFKVLSACHSWHKDNPPQNRVNIGKVIEVMNRQSAPTLNFLIKQLEQEKKDILVVKGQAQTMERSGTVTSNGSPMLKAKSPAEKIEDDELLDIGLTNTANTQKTTRVLSDA